MIHDAILLLWDYPIQSESSHPNQDFKDHIAHLSPPEKEIFLKIIKLAKSHGLIRNFIKKYSFISGKHIHNPNNKFAYPCSGLYIQAMSEGLDEILQPYHSHIVELERNVLENPHLPLTYVLGGIEKFKFLINTLTRILFSIKEKGMYGCQVLNVLHYNAMSGNIETTAAIHRLLHLVHKVFYEQLTNWMLYGELKDLRKEFFIHVIEKSSILSPTSNSLKILSMNSNDENQSGRTVNDSQNKFYKNIDYELDSTLLPCYIPLSMAQKIFFIGKSVVLFDSCPAQTNKKIPNLVTLERNANKIFTIWGDKEPIFHKSFQDLKNSELFDVYKLGELVDEIKMCVTKHLWTIAEEDAGVLHELQLMKDFFLLGRGELFLEWLRLATPILNSQSTATATRDINHAFHTAARAVFLGNSEDIEKFKFIIPFQKDSGSGSYVSNTLFGISDGWSTVTLKYNVKWPLHLLFTSEVLQYYNEMFRFLLRLKKTQHDLHLMWYTFKQTKSYGGSLWQLHNKLMFLMDNLQHYLQSDVLDSNYSKLRNEAQKIQDFELLKTAHHTFLIDILSQAFLLMTPNANAENQDEHIYHVDYNLNPVMSNIMEVLELCDAVCSISSEASDRDDEERLVAGYTLRFNILVGKLLQLLVALRSQPCGTHLAHLLMRLDFNRWFSSTAHLTQSVSCML